MDQDLAIRSSDSPLTLTNLSTNSLAATIDTIRKAEWKHWYLGLRQSELTIRDREGALEHNALALRKHQRHIRKLQRELDKLPAPSDLVLTPDEADRLEEIQDEIEAAKRAWINLQPLKRDAELELKAARSERQRLLVAHPEALALSFEEMQATYTDEALDAVEGFYIAARIWAAQNQLPAEVGVALFEAPPEKRERLMGLEMTIRTGVKFTEVQIHIAKAVAALPEAQQTHILQQIQTLQLQEAHE